MRLSVLVGLSMVATCLALPGGASAGGTPTGNFVPGEVTPPPPGRSLEGDLIAENSLATASFRPIPGAVEELVTEDGYHLFVETSPEYIPSPAYSAEVTAFLGSLLHGPELNQLSVYIAAPGELEDICENRQAIACYVSSRGTIYFVGQATYKGLPTDYVVAHEYGHRVEDYRHNPPFEGGPLVWGPKYWASKEQVCLRSYRGDLAPGGGGKFYWQNPAEAFAETYAWYHFGSQVSSWDYSTLLRPYAASYDALEKDVLEPWQPLRTERHGFLSSRRPRASFPLRTENDGRLQIRMFGGGDLDLGLVNSRGRLVASSVRNGTSQERINYLVCGERRMRLVVYAYRPPGRFRIDLSVP